VKGVKGDSLPTTSAIVIGGSLAGMCAARVLSDFVDTVTIVERDAYASAQDFRPGVPQARHVHNLLARGLREFEGFFPGFERRMREFGAVAVESGWTLLPCGPMGGVRGSGSIRGKLYGSVLYVMLSGGFLAFAVGPGYAIGQ
jgi:hypothetical protein